MKMSIKMKSAMFAFAFVTVATTGSSAFAAGEQCEQALRGINKSYASVAKWRVGSTNEVGSTIVRSTRAREKEIKELKTEKENTILGAATPVMEIVVAPGASAVVTEWGHYGTRNYTKVDVTTGGEPVLRGTLVLPVSAHTGVDDAKNWAVTDTYTIWVEVEGKTIYLVKDVKSLDLVTLQDIAIPLVKDKEVQIYYQRSGNSVWGFIEGRKMGFTWDGN